MALRIPNKWSYIIKYMGGHKDISEECDAILRFTKDGMEIQTLRKGKILLDYNNCTLEMQSDFYNGRIAISYKNGNAEGRIFLRLKKERDLEIVEVFNIYKKLALGQEDEISQDSKKYFKINFFRAKKGKNSN